MENWRFFIGACILTAGLLLPWAPWPSVAGGFILAAAIRWLWRKSRAELDPSAERRSEQ